ncbi:MAG: PAS domain S-box protein [Nitrospinae bacterium]|nr:PAS domain S-box protein [Nitrospinota bacterium]
MKKAGQKAATSGKPGRPAAGKKAPARAAKSAPARKTAPKAPSAPKGRKNDKYRILLENASDAILLADMEGKLKGANKKACQMLGYTSREIEKLHFTDIHPPETLEHAKNSFKEMAQTGFVYYHDGSILRKDGRRLPVDITATIVEIGGEKVAQGIFRDATVRKEAERALAESERKFRTSFENSTMGKALVSLNGEFIQVNNSFCWMLGYTRQELAGRLFQEFTHPDDLPAHLNFIRKIVGGHLESYQLEKRFTHKSGSTIWVILGVSMVIDPNGAPASLLFEAQDITQWKEYELELERRKNQLEDLTQERSAEVMEINDRLMRENAGRRAVEEALRRSEESLAIAQKITHIGNWDWDISANTLFWSDEIYRIFGLEPQEFGANYEAFVSYVHPEDRHVVQNEVEKALADPTGYYFVEHRVTRPGGEIRHVREEGQVFRDAAGAPTRMIGTVHDITEWKKYEERLVLATKVFENAAEGVMVTSDTGIIQFVNPAFTSITGYVPEEAIGHQPKILRSDRHSKDFYEDMWKTLTREGKWQGEIWNRRKDGEPYPEWLTITSIKDKMGRTTQYAAVFYDITELKRSQERIKYQANHDALTGLPNRTLFHDRLAVAMAHAHRHERKLAVLFIDLDNFKNINDSLGHAVGDILLQNIASRFALCAREEDTIARIGGDEFVILLEEIESEEAPLNVARRIIQTVSEPMYIRGHELYAGASIGVTIYPADGEDAETLLKNADTAMYRAKERGKNNFQLFTPSMNEKVVRRLGLENSLRKALDRDEMRVFYQPKVDVITRKLIGAEALLRWTPAGSKPVSPMEFIPVAEETGLIIRIGEWVMRATCDRTRRWMDMGWDSLVVSVNISARQLDQREFLDSTRAILEETALPPKMLEFEITESAVMSNINHAIDIMNRATQMGIGVSMDDFGTGYSSLSQLKKLPLNQLKIDKSFIHDVPEDKNAVAISLAIISMAHSMGMKVVAEGVETEEQLNFLKEHRCDTIQGYYFAKPMPAEEFEELLRRGGQF